MPATMAIAREIPAHVDPALVREWPLRPGAPMADPYEEIIPRIHAEWPEAVYARGSHSKGGDTWVFRRAAALRDIYMRSDLFTARQQTLMAKLVGEDWDMIPNEVDPPEHAFFRAVLNPRFTPSAVARMNEKVHQAARFYLDAMLPKGRGDFVSEFTLRFPIAIFLGLVDFPMDQVDYYLKLEHDLIADPDLGVKSRAMHMVLQILRDVIAERRRRPADDMFSYLLQAEHRGRKMTDHEVMRAGTTLYLGGLDTVAQVMGWSVRHLARHPGQQALLRNNPALIPGALDELIRAYAVSTTWRSVTRDVDFHGVRLARGDYVALPTFVAARDPSEYERPDVVDFDRANKRNLTFGTGAHNCIGIHLARRELLVALEEMLARCRNFRLADGQDGTWHFGAVIGLDRLMLEWDL